MSFEKVELQVGVAYVLLLPDEVRHVLGISEEPLIVECVCQTNDKHSSLGFLVPCIWGEHFFTPTVLGYGAEWKIQDTPA